jgi:hypothetical protein
VKQKLDELRCDARINTSLQLILFLWSSDCKTSCENHSGDQAKEGKAETESEGLKWFLDLIDSFLYTKPSPRAMAGAFEGERGGIGTSGTPFKAPEAPAPFKRSAPSPAPAPAHIRRTRLI